MKVPVSFPSDRDLADRLAWAKRAVDESRDPLAYPIGLQFELQDGERYLEAWSSHARAVAASEAYAGSVLYAHIPFCARVCTYCLLSSMRAPARDRIDAYVAALRRQIASFEPVVRGLSFSTLHVGGGTPTLLSEAQLEALLTALSVFSRTSDFTISIEAHPGTATEGKLELLRRHGVQRLSFGIETMTPAVLRNVNRGDQTADRVRRAIECARRLGFSVNVDLLGGLPGETEESFESSLREVLELEPDSMSVNRFIAENSPLGRHGYGPDEQENRRADRMLLLADRVIRETRPPRWPAAPLRMAGYGTQYVWDRGERARPYFQQDMIGPASTLAIGHGGLGKVFGRMFAIPAGSLEDYMADTQRGAPPRMAVCSVSPRFEIAFYVTDQACRGQLSTSDLVRIFGKDVHAIERELSFLWRRGLLVHEDGQWRKPPNYAFQAIHLLAFLCRNDRSSSGRQERTAFGEPQGAWRGIAALHADHEVIEVRKASSIDLRENGVIALLADGSSGDREIEEALSVVRRSSPRRVALWAEPPSFRAAVNAVRSFERDVDELVLCFGADAWRDAGQTRAQADAVVAKVRERRDMRINVCLQFTSASEVSNGLADVVAARVDEVMLFVERALGPDEAHAVLRLIEGSGSRMRLLSDPDVWAGQYAAIRAEMPPSLLWCRIAMRAARAASGFTAAIGKARTGATGRPDERGASVAEAMPSRSSESSEQGLGPRRQS